MGNVWACEGISQGTRGGRVGAAAATPPAGTPLRWEDIRHYMNSQIVPVEERNMGWLQVRGGDQGKGEVGVGAEVC